MDPRTRHALARHGIRLAAVGNEPDIDWPSVPRSGAYGTLDRH